MKTLGEERVGVDFNPSNNEAVHRLKEKAADLINDINALIEPRERSEKTRCMNVAMNKIEEGAMWAVKGIFR